MFLKPQRFHIRAARLPQRIAPVAAHVCTAARTRHHWRCCSPCFQVTSLLRGCVARRSLRSVHVSRPWWVCESLQFRVWPRVRITRLWYLNSQLEYPIVGYHICIFSGAKPCPCLVHSKSWNILNPRFQLLRQQHQF